MAQKITEKLGIDILPNYWDRRYTKNLEQLSTPTYKVKQIKDVYMTLRDGVKLCVDVYLPEGSKKCPGLVSWSAYSKTMQNIKRGAIPPESLLFDHSLEAGDIDYFVSRGYAFIIPDPRGIGKSEGTFYGVYNPQEQQDIYDMIEWAAIQEWCDGGVGMIGYSYFGICQMLAAALQPPSLKCIMPCSFVDDYYQHGYYGGVGTTYMSIYHELCPSHDTEPWSLKLYGEEKLKEMMAERLKDPDIAVNSYFTKILTTWPPKYHSFYLDFLLNPLDNEFWQQRSCNKIYNKVKIPVYLHCAWSPLGRWSAPIFEAMNDDNLSCPKRLGVLEGYDGLELPYRALNEECLRWYDHWLKDVETGITEEPAMKLNIIGRGYRYETEYPLARTDWKKLYLHTFEQLRWTPAAEGNLPPDSFTHRPPHITTKVETLCYRTDRFTRPTDFTGPIELHLFAAIDAPDANFIVKLWQITAGGTRMPVCRTGSLKASYALDKENSQIGRPAHDFSKRDYITPGEIREYVIEINPIGMVFAPGTAIELEIKAMDNFQHQEHAWEGKMAHLGPIPSADTINYRIYRDKDYQSHILMPYIPYTPNENWLQSICDDDIVVGGSGKGATH